MMNLTGRMALAAALAVANAGVGVLIHQGCLRAYRHFRRGNSHVLS